MLLEEESFSRAPPSRLRLNWILVSFVSRFRVVLRIRGLEEAIDGEGRGDWSWMLVWDFEILSLEFSTGYEVMLLATGGGRRNKVPIKRPKPSSHHRRILMHEWHALEELTISSSSAANNDSDDEK